MPPSVNIQNTDILDGGMGHMLRRLGVSIDGAEIGSIQRFHKITMINVSNPEIVQKAHLAFLEAGCNIITTNNYAAVPKCLLHEVLSKANYGGLTAGQHNEGTKGTTIADILRETGFFDEYKSPDKEAHSINTDYRRKEAAIRIWKDVVIAAGENAFKARERFCESQKPKGKETVKMTSVGVTRHQNRLKIAGSLPPLAESYRPDLIGSFEDNVLQYRVIVNALIDYVDCFLCETMSTAMESKAAVVAAVETMEVSGKDPFLRSGESITTAVTILKDYFSPGGAVQAILFNCSSPEVITAALPILRNIILSMSISVKIGAYANGFVTIFGECPPVTSCVVTPKPESRTNSSTTKSSEYRQDLTPLEYYDQYVKKWLEVDKTEIVGGCCGIFPEHIAHIAAEIGALEEKYVRNVVYL